MARSLFLLLPKRRAGLSSSCFQRVWRCAYARRLFLSLPGLSTNAERAREGEILIKLSYIVVIERGFSKR